LTRSGKGGRGQGDCGKKSPPLSGTNPARERRRGTCQKKKGLKGQEGKRQGVCKGMGWGKGPFWQAKKGEG